MQIVNYLRATVFKSSYAALDLARENQKYSDLAMKIVSVKQSNALRDLIISHSDSKKHNELAYNINKYDFVLSQLSSIGNRTTVTANVALSDSVDPLPRMKVIRVNNNDHEYFSPYNNKPSNLVITKADETLI